MIICPSVCPKLADAGAAFRREANRTPLAEEDFEPGFVMGAYTRLHFKDTTNVLRSQTATDGVPRIVAPVKKGSLTSRSNVTLA